MSTEITPEVVCGAKAIAPHIGRTTRAAFHAMERGQVPGAIKVGGRWTLNLRVFHAAFETQAVA